MKLSSQHVEIVEKKNHVEIVFSYAYRFNMDKYTIATLEPQLIIKLDKLNKKEAQAVARASCGKGLIALPKTQYACALKDYAKKLLKTEKKR